MECQVDTNAITILIIHSIAMSLVLLNRAYDTSTIRQGTAQLCIKGLAHGSSINIAYT